MTAKKPHPKLKAAVPRGSNLWTARKGKLSGGIIAMSSAAIVAIYTLGRANTSSGSEELLGDPSIAAATATVTTPANTSRVVSPTIEAPAGGRTAPSATRSAGATASYKDGSYKGNGTSRHGDMEVTVVIKDGKIASANVTSCSTHYPCSDVKPLVKATVSTQAVPTNHVSGASDSSKAYKQAVTNALELAKA